jgi:hypothetical protein
VYSKRASKCAFAALAVYVCALKGNAGYVVLGMAKSEQLSIYLTRLSISPEPLLGAGGSASPVRRMRAQFPGQFITTYPFAPSATSALCTGGVPEPGVHSGTRPRPGASADRNG